MMTRVIFTWQAPNSIASMVNYSGFTSICNVRVRFVLIAPAPRFGFDERHCCHCFCSLTMFSCSCDPCSHLAFPPQGSKDNVEGAFTPGLNELLNHTRLETNYSTSSHRVEHTAQLPIPATITKP
jgi:hypothetical protein